MPDLLDHLPPALLVIFRIGGLTIYGPVFGSPVIPVRVKVLMVFGIGLLIYPLLAREVFNDAPLTLDLWGLAPLVAGEMLLGFVIGYLASIPLVAVQTGGLLMGQQMGLGFAQFYNPGIDDEADVVGQMLFFMALAGFLLVGGHEAMMLALLHTFDHIPLGSFAVDLSVLDLLTGVLLAAFELALRVAAPVLVLVFLQSIALGYMSRTVPQLNILSLGFPIRILIGFGIVGLGLVVINEVVMDEIDRVLALLFEWIGERGEGVTR